MSKYLVIGDVHATVDELEDCQRLIDGILDIAIKEKPDNILFLGDLYHTHSVIQLDVMAFWQRALVSLSEFPIKVIVGNHDKSGNASNPNHALSSLRFIPNVQVIDSPVEADGALFLPYTHSEEEFRGWVSDSKAATVFCHQTLQGAKYDNGFFAKDAFNLEGFSDKTFVSGHIHKPTSYSNVVYVGAPRWKTLSDANIDRFISIYDISPKLPPFRAITFRTDKFCQPIIHLTDTQDSPFSEELNPNAKYIVDIHGDEEFIRIRKARFANCRVRTFKTQTKTTSVKESMGISKAIKAFVEGYTPRFGTPKDKLEAMVQLRIKNG
jgi:predicted phosphodiesterase